MVRMANRVLSGSCFDPNSVYIHRFQESLEPICFSPDSGYFFTRQTYLPAQTTRFELPHNHTFVDLRGQYSHQQTKHLFYDTPIHLGRKIWSDKFPGENPCCSHERPLLCHPRSGASNITFSLETHFHDLSAGDQSEWC